MKWLYIICSYVVIAVIGLLGLKHINDLSNTVRTQQWKIDELKQSKAMVIDAFNEEIAEVRRNVKERDIVVKEIVKVVKGTDDEKCLNSRIPDPILDRVRNYKNK